MWYINGDKMTILNKIKVENRQKEEEKDLNDLKKLLETYCKRCSRKISLMTCRFDDYENPICFEGCYG